MAATLSVSIVSYQPEIDRLRQTLRTLCASLGHAKMKGLLDSARISIVDNGPGTGFVERLRQLLEEEIGSRFEREERSDHGNVGYGRAHNLVLLASSAQYHLVLNPDVTLAEDAVAEALGFMRENPDVVILSPAVRGPDGEAEYLCKRYPALLDLALRGFAPAALKGMFRERLARYEMRDLPQDAPSRDVPLVSGAFMFCRRAAIAQIGGFSGAFFLYFEDFDLSLRAAARGSLAFVPSVRIVHHGGYAARKGRRHLLLFVRSVFTFYRRHGWSWL